MPFNYAISSTNLARYYDYSLILEPVSTAGYYLEGTAGNDSLYGSIYDDEIHGGEGNDYLSGGRGNDLLFGEDGNDTLSGGAGNDVLDGGSGNDLLLGGVGADQNIGGAGYDTVSYAASTAGVSVNLAFGYGIGGHAQGDTYSGIERIVGSSYNDTLISDTSIGVRFEGGAGNDGLRGGSGVDHLDGGSGDDWIEGGRGIDVLTGGSGYDTFVFRLGDGPDLVMDFQSGVDRIALRVGGDSGFSGADTTFGSDLQLERGTDVWDHVQSVGWRGRDQLFYDTDDHQLYQITRDGPAPGVEVSLLATFANDVQVQTSDFVFI